MGSQEGQHFVLCSDWSEAGSERLPTELRRPRSDPSRPPYVALLGFPISPLIPTPTLIPTPIPKCTSRPSELSHHTISDPASDQSEQKVKMHKNCTSRLPYSTAFVCSFFLHSDKMQCKSNRLLHIHIYSCCMESLMHMSS